MSQGKQNFIYVDDVYLSDNGLKNLNLKVLERNCYLYSTMIFQPCGEITTGNFFINSNKSYAYLRKCESFFDLAIQEDVNLAITPEYSCPWNVIETLLKNKKFPTEENIWVIGSESITQEELCRIIKKHDEIVWVYQKNIFDKIEKNMFLDPVCYFLNSRDININSLKKVIIIQFKTHPMGGHFLERDHLLVGNDIYVIKNNQHSIGLITLICSESLIFEENKLPDPDGFYLLIHIQLNKEPFHDDFSKYRRDYYKLNIEQNKMEMICLNWAKKSFMDGELFSLYGGSALYTKASKINLVDAQIKENHKKGLYYSYWSHAYAHIYFFNYAEYVFKFKNTKVNQGKCPIPNQGNCGPQQVEIYKWSNKGRKNRKSNYYKKKVHIKNSADRPEWKVIDHINEVCTLKCDSCVDYCPLHNKKLESIDKERFIVLSIGGATCINWFRAQNLKCFETRRNNERNEADNRLTFLQDPDEKIRRKKRKLMSHFLKIYKIIQNEANFPEAIGDLANNCHLDYKPEKSYLYNLYSKTSGATATVVYIDDNSKVSAESTFTEMCNLFNGSQSDKRVVVWYGDIEEGIKSKDHSNVNPRITENTNRPGNSINKRW